MIGIGIGIGYTLLLLFQFRCCYLCRKFESNLVLVSFLFFIFSHRASEASECDWDIQHWDALYGSALPLITSPRITKGHTPDKAP